MADYKAAMLAINRLLDHKGFDEWWESLREDIQVDILEHLAMDPEDG